VRYEKIIPSLPPLTETTRPYLSRRRTSRTEHPVKGRRQASRRRPGGPATSPDPPNPPQSRPGSSPRTH